MNANHRITVVNICRDMVLMMMMMFIEDQKKPTWMTSIQNYLDLEILGLGEVEEGEGSQEEEEDGDVDAVGVASCHHAALGGQSWDL